jgi:uncharacterized membrane protein YccC
LTSAVRQAARFDRRLVSPTAGLLAAIPVVAVLGGSIAAGDPVAGATMGAGAMLVGIAWRAGGGRPPLALMATDAAVMAASTFVGSVTGSVTWLHLLVLCGWSMLAGLLVGLGSRGAVVGTQAIIALVVFGRFSEPVLPALGLAGFVFAGGCAQVLFLSLARLPTTLRSQREATSNAYLRLSALAAAQPGESTLPAAVALDEAEATLSSLSLFGDPALMTLRSLVNEGRRMRIALSAVHALVGQRYHTDPSRGAIESACAGTLALAATALGLAASAIEGDRESAAALTRPVAQFSAQAAMLTSEVQSGDREVSGPPASALPVARAVMALAGQLRAVATLAPAAGADGGLRSRGRLGPIKHPLAQLRADLALIQANASLQSPAGRHALRLAVIVPGTELIARVLPLQRSYWMVVAAATVLRPEFGATFTRGTERALGTGLGVALAGAIAVGLHPAGAATVVLVGLLAWAGYATFPASFAVGFGFITALVVLLLNVVSPDTVATAEARLLDALVGGAIGLLAYALWPTWSHTPARQALADLVDAQREYLGKSLAAVQHGRRVDEHEMRPLARRARLARTNAEATVARSLSEPQTRRIDADQSQGVLVASRRLIQAGHVLRLDVQEDRQRTALPALGPLARDIDEQLLIVAGRLRSAPQGTSAHSRSPDLRTDYAEFEPHCPRDLNGVALLAEIDEIVDAANSLTSLIES